ncbi:MAG: biosynthetic arginine decarboxylase [Phycisphaerales bacterium JB039]
MTTSSHTTSPPPAASRSHSTSAPTGQQPAEGWSVADAEELYGLRRWGKGHFAISERGTVLVMPDGRPERAADLYDIVAGVDERGIIAPVLIRFPDMLSQRLRRLREAFDRAIADHGYTGGYKCVYPIKVNQQRRLCEEIRDLAEGLGFGLEAGSKPELLAVLALTAGRPGMPIICNGFKDEEYIEAVILAGKLGRTIYPVVERFNDLQLIAEMAARHDVRPHIGIRIKPSARGAGRWVSSGGMRSKFGLSSSEALRALEFLQERNMAPCLEMIHFHIGSQICDIRQFKGAISELAHTYAELRRLGATGLSVVDVGGGLGVDYDGSASAWDSSVNYDIDEYAADVVHRIKSVCDDARQPHPTILSESGRAMVAHSTVLVMDVLGKTRFPRDPELDVIKARLSEEEEPPQPVLDLLDALERASGDRPVEAFHDAAQAREEAASLFSLGYISLPMRAAAERLYWATGRRVMLNPAVQAEEELSEELRELPVSLSDIYYCNFSLFQSLPDAWAIDQVFPILPIHRLDEEPLRRGVLADITCDSDGKIDRFASPDGADYKRTLELHELKEGQTYYLGVFLVGAYQEVLGDLHNLFGDTNAVHVSIDEEGGWTVEEVIEGDTVREVLSYVQFDPRELRREMRKDVEKAVKEGRLRVDESRSLLRFYDDGLDGYTYLE